MSWMDVDITHFVTIIQFYTRFAVYLISYFTPS